MIRLVTAAVGPRTAGAERDIDVNPLIHTRKGEKGTDAC